MSAQVWPDGVQSAVTITVNFDGESVDHNGMELPLWGRYSHGRYGAQMGARNLLRLFERYGVRATFFVGGWDVERYPELMRDIVSAGHEVAGHGYLHEDFSALSTDEQSSVLDRSEAAFESILGRKPLGFRAPERLMSRHTRNILIARGYRYDSGYSDDDVPYLVTNAEPRALVELPAHDPWSDKTYYEKHRTPAVVRAALVDEFDGTYSYGCLFNLSVHPRGDYGSGRGLRTRAIEPLLRTIAERPRVWIATCEEIAAWVLEREGREPA